MKGVSPIARKKDDDEERVVKPKLRPALTPEAREKQLIALAVDLAEERLRNGTATSQEVTHFLKLGSMKNQLEMEKLKEENELLKAKTSAIKSGEQSAEIYIAAIKAMKKYSGSGGDEDDEDDEEFF